MRKLFSLIATFAIMFGFAVPLFAQDGATYTAVAFMDVAPEDAEAALAQIKIVRDAAIEVGIDPRFEWQVYRWDNELLFVSSDESPTDLFDENGMPQAFAGTAAESRVQAAFKKFGSLKVISQTQSVLRPRPDLGYVPANPGVEAGTHGGIFVINEWPKAGSWEDYVAVNEKLLELLTELDSPYPVLASQDLIGDGSMNFAVVFDNLSNFFGEHSIETELAASGLGDEWRAAQEALSKVITRSESRILMYMPEHSFQPAESATQDN